MHNPWPWLQSNFDFAIWSGRKPQPVEPNATHEIDTGRIGTLVGVNLVTDAFTRKKRVPDYVYHLTKRVRNKNGHFRVLVLVWKPGDNTEYWFKFRSARNAHDAFKRIARRRK